jgi:hypothetical protein
MKTYAFNGEYKLIINDGNEWDGRDVDGGEFV